MTFNSSQQERLLAALERIADTAVRIADAFEAQAYPPLPTTAQYDGAGRLVRDTDIPSTKGPYR